MFKIVSGGQTGVDRAALDSAIKLNIIHSGYCPKGRKSEDGIISQKYNLIETKSKTYKTRTYLNVKNSDATLILYSNTIFGGTKYTINCCKKLNKPFITININNLDITSIKIWYKKNFIHTLNIAGPRENDSNIYFKSKLFFNYLFKIFKSEQL